MRFLFYTDPHWCQNSSILRSRGKHYSTRLENLIESLNWVEQAAVANNCSTIVCGGDFFDSSHLNSEEISALREINWAPLSHVFITGNHESGQGSLDFSTTELFNLCSDAVVISQPITYNINDETGSFEVCFLPYIMERERHDLIDYFPPSSTNRIIFSHNDLKDIQYGQFKSVDGFSLAEIEANCTLFFNGHLHHRHEITDKIINAGNLTGQNFTEDSGAFTHGAYIIDTADFSYKFIQNPYAMTFWKLDAKDQKSIEMQLSQLPERSIISMSVKDCDLLFAKNLVDSYYNILASRILADVQIMHADNVSIESLQTIDHLKQFEKFILESWKSDTELLKSELIEVLK